MKAQLAGLAALAALLTGCGTADTKATDEPTGAGSPGGSMAPHWPTTGCEEHSASSIDYTADVKGADTRQQALAEYTSDGTIVVRDEEQPHSEPRWLVVNSDNEIVRALTMLRVGDGWLVDGVEECSG